MKIVPFKPKEYSSRIVSKAKYFISSADCEPLTFGELCDLSGLHFDKLRNIKLGYTSSKGSPQLRKEISSFYDSTQRDDILVCVPQEGIFLIMNVLLDPDDHVVVAYPSFPSLSVTAEAIGCQVSYWKVKKENKKWYFDIYELKKLCNTKTKLIVINFPHNPTGAMICTSMLEELIDFARARGIYIFSDEMYYLLHHVPSIHLTPITDLYEKGISLFGMSKTFSMAGVRLGWLATRDKEILKKCMEFKDYTTMCHGVTNELIALYALLCKDQILKRNISIIRKNKKVLKNFVETYSEFFNWISPEAGSVCLLEVLPMEATNLCQILVEQVGVFVLPAFVYGFEDKYIRLGLGRKSFASVLERVEQCIKKMER